MHKVPVGAEIDLHFFSPKDVPSVLEEYLRVAHEQGLERVRVVHGRGRGVQRGIVQAVIDKHDVVVEFWDDTASHLGATIVRLKIG